MMIEQHYDEEVLIALLDEQNTDPHLQACDTCKSALHSIRQVTSALHDDTVWDRRELSEEPKASTREALRFAATSVAAEDAAAEPWVKQLLAKSSTEWASMVAAHPEWKTAGFVRRLIVAVDAINFTAPTDAVELMRIAVEIAEALPGGGDRVAKLRAISYKELAYAQQYVGSYVEALNTINKCDVYLDRCLVQDFDRGNALLVRASIAAAMENLPAALDQTRRARRLFHGFGAHARVVVAEIFEAAMLTRMRKHSDALDVYLGIIQNPAADALTRACAVMNAGLSCGHLSQGPRARAFLSDAAIAFEKLRVPALRTKARWSLAQMLSAETKYDEALVLFYGVRQELEELGMAHDVALSSVDTAEALLMSERTHEVRELCVSAISYFESAKLTYTQGALTALAYLREAAEKKTLTLPDVRDVRAFIEILPTQPALLFARPT